MKKNAAKALCSIVLLACFFSYNSNAATLPIFNSSDGWTQFANDDGYRVRDGYVNPGYGGQNFDAEYLFYKIQNGTLSIGLQTGFDLSTGIVRHGNIDYYAGDLALSFDGNASTYEYAVDFGLKTKNYGAKADASLSIPVGGNKAIGIDTAGIYSVTQWNKDIYSGFYASNPFAMDSGTFLGQLTENLSGSGNTGISSSDGYSYGGYSYYRIVSFQTYPIFEIIPGNPILLNAHWTMSCGNDAINGTASVPNPIPEPGTIALIGSLITGILGFTGLCKRNI